MTAGAPDQRRNRLTAWLLVGLFMSLFVGSVLFVSLRP